MSKSIEERRRVKREYMRRRRAASVLPATEGSKVCTKCGVEKGILEFYEQVGTKDGRYSSCSPCQRATARATQKKYQERYSREAKERYDPVKASVRWAEYSAKNRERLREAGRRYGAQNKEKLAESHKRWREKNLGYSRERVRKYYQENLEESRAKARARYEANREKERARYDAWRRTPAGQRSQRARSVRRLARQKNAAGSATTKQIYDRIGYYGGRCWMCGAEWEHVDHVIPLSKGGSNWPANLRPACADCNIRKRDKRVAA